MPRTYRITLEVEDREASEQTPLELIKHFWEEDATNGYDISVKVEKLEETN